MVILPFTPGSTLVRRDVLGGKVWTASAYRVLSDDGQQLSLACWPGSPSYVPTTWIRWLHDRDDATRKQGIPGLASGQWQLGMWAWRDTILLNWTGLDPDFSLIYLRAAAGGTHQWKVNFERPVRRTPLGIDTFDLLLDLTSDTADGPWQWKDKDEYEHARRLGIISGADHHRVELARQRAIAFVEARSGPLAQDWSTWEVPAAWPVPVLPQSALELGAA